MEKKQKQATETEDTTTARGHGHSGFRMVLAGLMLVNLLATGYLAYATVELKTKTIPGSIEAFKQLEYDRAGGKEMFDLIAQYQKLSASQQKPQIEAAIKQLGGTAAAGSTGSSGETADASKTLSADDYAAVMKDSFVEGKKDAKITLVEYSDLECPYCIIQYKNKTISKLQEKYGDSVNVIYKPLNLARHPGADQKGMASICVAQLGGADKYAKYYKAILEGSNERGPVYSLDNLKSLAKQVGVDAAKFATCYDGKKTETVYQAYTTEALKHGVEGTPTTMVLNNETKKYELVKGAADIGSFYPVVDRLMN